MSVLRDVALYVEGKGQKLETTALVPKVENKISNSP